MPVRISWSGDQSQQAAVLAHYWLKSVMPDVDFVIAGEDIKHGGSLAISAAEDNQTAAVILCLTAENMKTIWTAFETGLLYARYDQRLHCLLMGVKPKEAPAPFSYVRHVLPIRQSMFSMARALNQQAGGMPEETLNHNFDIFWPEFSRRINAFLTADVSAGKAAAQHAPQETPMHLTSADSVITLIKGYVPMFVRGEKEFAPLKNRMISRKEYLGQITALLDKKPDYIKGIVTRAENDADLLDGLINLSSDGADKYFDQKTLSHIAAAREKAIDNIAAMIGDYVNIFAQKNKVSAYINGRHVLRQSYVSQLRVVINEVPNCGRSILTRAQNDLLLLTGIKYLLEEEAFAAYFNDVFPLAEFGLSMPEITTKLAVKEPAPENKAKRKTYGMHSRLAEEEAPPSTGSALHSLKFVKDMNKRSAILIKASQSLRKKD